MGREDGRGGLKRIRYVAANYEHLQGLRKLPFGIFLLVLVSTIVLLSVWTTADGDAVSAPVMLGILALIFLLFVAGIALPHFISAYYERRYGTVQRYRAAPTKRRVMYLVMILALVLSSSLSLLVLGVAMMVAYWADRRFQRHYVVIGALATGAALAHLAYATVRLVTEGWISIENVSYLPQIFIVVTIASYLLAGGVLDHLLLIRTMKTVPEEGDARAV